MKALKMLVFAIILIVNINIAKAQIQVNADVTFSVFHDNLIEYGRWVDNPTYGPVWIPDEENFVPYRTNGHWAYTDDGWTWVSDYDWGWAPFHYGRWNYDDSYGAYYWVPGYEWGPAWVSWRRSNDMYGWAPLSPGMTIGIGMSFGNEIPVNRWTFVNPQYITHPHINRYYVDQRSNVTIINNTTIINNVHQNNYHTVVVGGPRRSEVEHFTHSRINTYVVNNASRPSGAVINRNTINIYRPVVNKTTVINKTVINNTNNNRTRIENNQGNGHNSSGVTNPVDSRRKPDMPARRTPGLPAVTQQSKPSQVQRPVYNPVQQRPVNRLVQQPQQNKQHPVTNNNSPQQHQQQPTNRPIQQTKPQPLNNQPHPVTNHTQSPQQNQPKPQQRPVMNPQQQQQSHPQQRVQPHTLPPPHPATNQAPPARTPEDKKP